MTNHLAKLTQFYSSFSKLLLIWELNEITAQNFVRNKWNNKIHRLQHTGYIKQGSRRTQTNLPGSLWWELRREDRYSRGKYSLKIMAPSCFYDVAAAASCLSLPIWWFILSEKVSDLQLKMILQQLIIGFEKFKLPIREYQVSIELKQVSVRNQAESVWNWPASLSPLLLMPLLF